MAEIGWDRRARVAGAPAAPEWLARLTARLTDWEDWLTLVLALGATLSVSAGLHEMFWYTTGAVSTVRVSTTTPDLVLCTDDVTLGEFDAAEPAPGDLP